MFDIVRLDLARQWFTPSLATVAELLVFYDVVSIRAPWGRLDDLVQVPADDMRLFRRLVDDGRIILELDQMPLGEVAYELGLFQNGMALRSDPDEAEESIRNAFAVAPVAGYNPYLQQGEETRRFYADWQEVISKVHNPGRQPGHARALVDRAIDRMNMIADPAFIDVALPAYGGASTAGVRKMLASVALAEFEVGGRQVRGFDAPAFGASAELLEFLSQADELLDVMVGATRDNFTAPTFEAWTHSVASRSVGRAGVGADIDAFTTSVLGRSGVAAAIESGAKSFRDIEELLERREPFAKVLRGRDDDTSLAKAYFEEVGNVSWLAHGPGRGVRFTAFAAAAAIAGLALTPVAGVAVATGLSAIDYFVVDALIKGNGCRTFIESDVAEFVGA
ncbi:hypothetical protein [Sphingomonas sanguinis]|uniref:Uncharacterized protein n=1 Tax=Sphingomonas sanguinis TaxID=33051 RepID=A0A147I1F5_9SPHN|nr:hypothetical protein [Sphingomonas sanguinis]KTT71304.1 hypothetical protein NS319_06370 [Sphingomonas sanguinis]